MSEFALSKEEVEDALAEIRLLADEEYGRSLEDILNSVAAEDCLRRMSGILIKRPFATRNPPNNINPTNANYSWHWEYNRFLDAKMMQSDEYKILKEIRDSQFNNNWSDLAGITNETGLMWAVGKWLAGKISAKDKTFKDCYYDSTSAEVNLLLNAANLVPFASLLAGVVGGPVIAVQLSLYALQFGYEKLTEVEPKPDD